MAVDYFLKLDGIDGESSGLQSQKRNSDHVLELGRIAGVLRRRYRRFGCRQGRPRPISAS